MAHRPSPPSNAISVPRRAPARLARIAPPEQTRTVGHLGSGSSHHIRRFYQAMKDSPGYPLAHLVGEVIPASMEERNPLQAADALAWHERRFVENGTRDRNFFRLLKGKSYIHEYKKEELEEFINGLLARAAGEEV